MQLRHVDPRILLPNPNNPRRTAAPAGYDQQLTASIRETNGPIQPPVVRLQDDGSLMIVAGHRRVASSIAAELAGIDVFVREADASGDSMASFAENMVRTGMCSVDIWRAVEAFIGEGYTEDGIGTALSLPVRAIRRLRLFAKVLPAMLERMAQGDEPNEGQLRTIASATRDEQAAAWKKNKPKRTETTNWHLVQHALRKARIGASVAKFDDEFAQSFGLIWTEDLFAEGDKDPRFTDQVELFMATQHAWLEQNLPPNGEILEVGQHGEPKLPPKAQEAWGSDKKRKGVHVGLWIDRHSGEVREKHFLYPEPVKSSALGSAGGQIVKASRPDISGKGQELIGNYRTQALQQALAEGEVRDDQLIGLLILALAGSNVRVEQDARMYRVGSRREVFARAISDGGLITGDIDTLRASARGILAEVLSCKVGMTGSGTVGRIAGASIRADGYLPNMAHDEFLTKLSKDGITRAVQAEKILPRNTGKEMRAALKEHVGQGIYVHPAACFGLTDDEQKDLARHRADDLASDNTPAGHDPEDPDGSEDGVESASEDQGQDEEEDAGVVTLPPPDDAMERQAAA